MTTSSPSTEHLPKLLCSLGMVPLSSPVPPSSSPTQSLLNVLLDGRVVGVASAAVAEELAVKLRILKATGREKVMDGVWGGV